jgi:UDP-2-acetamido-2,6-beta-L-arabino-hexul-4-ose reductase
LKVLVTGADGFIGKNLFFRLKELSLLSPLTFTRNDSINDLNELIDQSDVIVHLAGENRPKNVSEYESVNVGLTKILCDIICKTQKKIPIIFASSSQYKLDNPYGKSKRDAELLLKKLAFDNGNSVYIYRLPGVFGKWCKPNYNSVVATFCHNIIHDIPIKINNKYSKLSLVYIDDVISDFIQNIQKQKQKQKQNYNFVSVKPEYKTTLGEIASQINAFKKSRSSLIIENVGSGFTRALYSTFISYLTPANFAYKIPIYRDNRGDFIEILKTKNNGQFSFFTAHPGVTRGEHYHHTKTEKFLVVDGTASFKFRNISTDESYEIIINSQEYTIVDSTPGWAHNITNVGEKNLLVILWANEILNKDSPDTFSTKL